MRAVTARIGLVASSLFVVLTFAITAQAAIVAEWDFQNVTGNLSVAAGGASTTSTILGGTINTGPNAGLGTADPDAALGSFNVAGGGGTGDERGLRTSGANSSYTSYLGQEGGLNNFHAGTVLAVYKPSVARSTDYRTLFSGAKFFASNSTALFIGRTPSQDGAQADYVGLNVGNGAGSVFVAATTSTAGTSMWDTNTWYLVGGSWAPNQPAVIFRRAITGPDLLSELSAISGTNLTATSGNTMNFVPLAVGATQVFGGTEPAQFGANGSIAFVRLLDTYTSSAAGFRAIWQTVLPEPGVGATILAMAGLMLRRRRK